MVVSVLMLAGFAAPDSDTNSSVRLKYFNVNEEGNTFVLSWESAEEADVLKYAIERKTTFSNNEFVPLKEVSPQGQDVRYLHRDDQVFKTGGGDVVDYRLMAVYHNGSREILVTKSVNYTPTALRRTWGSIKAMF